MQNNILKAHKWKCAVEASGITKGFNHPGIMGFQGKAFAAFIREMIQNALDANKNEEAIKIKIDHKKIPRNEIPDIQGMLGIIESCRATEKNAKVKAFLDNAVAELSEDTIHVLQLSDWNTVGLQGSVLKTDSTAHAFMKADGVTEKADVGATGSFGIGKFAQYTLSHARATIVSSVGRDDEGNYRPMVQGKMILKSHVKKSEAEDRDIVFSEEAFFGPDDNRFDAIYSYDNVPKWLQRGDGAFNAENQGTTINVIAFRHEPNWKEHMIAVVLQNFFKAIMDGKMEVTIEDVVIDSSTIANLFQDNDIIHAAKENNIDDFVTSYQYYTVLSNADTITEITNIPELGEMKFSMLVDREFEKNVLFVRNGMKITDNLNNLKKFPSLKAFSCVVEPNEKGASEILRQMEPPAHDDFLPMQAADPVIAKRILKTLELAIKTFINEHAGYKMSQESNITELNELLADTTDEQNGNLGEYNLRGEVKITEEIKTVRYGGRREGNVSVGVFDENGETETLDGNKTEFKQDEVDTKSDSDFGDNEPSKGTGYRISSPAKPNIEGENNVTSIGEGKKGVRMHIKHRGVFTGPKMFKLETHAKEPVAVEIKFQRTGISEEKDMKVVSTSKGKVIDGKLQVNLNQNETQIVVTFDTDFREGAVGIITHAI